MALDGQALSPKEFKLLFVAESTIGDGNTTTMQTINVDSVEMPSFNPTQVFDVRSGDGRTAKVADAYISQKAVQHEVNFSGTADQTVLPLLLQNIVTTAVGSSPASYDIASNYTPPELQHGAASGITKTVCVAIVNPEAGDDHSIILPGCVLTSLSLTGDMGTENGRIKMSGTFTTGYKPTTGAAAPTSAVAYGSTFYYLTTMNGAKKVAGKGQSVLQSMTLNLENPASFLGYQGDDANPQAIARAIPEISASMDATIKLDDNTADVHTNLLAGDTVETELSNNATWASATTFGIKGSYGKVTSVAFNEAAAMMVDVSVKFFAHTSGDVIQIIA
jgi:hypothetical protein